MYLLNKILNVNWTIYSNVAPPSLTDLKVVQYHPDSVTNSKFSINNEDYLRPSINSLGFITYSFIPDTVGLWKISLYISDTLIHTHKILVSKNDISIKKFIDTSLL